MCCDLAFALPRIYMNVPWAEGEGGKGAKEGARGTVYHPTRLIHGRPYSTKVHSDLFEWVIWVVAPYGHTSARVFEMKEHCHCVRVSWGLGHIYMHIGITIGPPLPSSSVKIDTMDLCWVCEHTH